jgi:hypothetical protein
MSDLDVPRPHLAGAFTADPSTLRATISSSDPPDIGEMSPCIEAGYPR